MRKKVRLNHIIFAAIAIVAVVSLFTFWSVCNHKVFNMITERVVEDYSQTTMAVQKNVETLISYTEDFSKYLAIDEQMQSLIEEQKSASKGQQLRSDVEIRQDWQKLSRSLIYSTSRLAGFGVYAGDELLYSYYNSFVSYDTDIISETDLTRAESQKSPLWTDLMTLKSTGGWYHKEEPVYSVLKYVQDVEG